MKVAVTKETFAGDRRVAIVPAVIPSLTKAGCQVIVERDAGLAAGFRNEEYEEKGATIVDSRDEAFAADVVLQVRLSTTDAQSDDIQRVQPHQTLIAMCDPLNQPATIRDFAKTRATLFSLELIPRITRAQSMDVLSSMATVAGYRAVMLAAIELPKMFPLMMTAAGTLTPARAFVVGAGVAGLQAIATAKRLGAVVQAYDVRPTVREQVESLGGKFVELQLESNQAEDKGGYAKELGEDFYQKQRQLMAEVVKESDVVITTAAIPGKQSPLLITADAVQAMHPGSVIVDLAAERGGNCELSQPDQRVTEHGVTILGPTNLAGEVPFHASQMFAKNITTFLLSMINDGQPSIDFEDEVVRDTIVAKDGEIMNQRVRDLLDLPPLEPVESGSPSETTSDD